MSRAKHQLMLHLWAKMMSSRPKQVSDTSLQASQYSCATSRGMVTVAAVAFSLFNIVRHGDYIHHFSRQYNFVNMHGTVFSLHCRE
jgi:hypothetical protein